ncbi:fumarylacetoacetate hydrolase family protein [Paraburkholderia fungorum]|uniref:5-carboxymethyl-2-hydroxymuconate isomerase n=1 Tax=Paraburkholderia fungorum TaxID=134537 RepID=A0A420GT50_9BURK|nr:fumarylacetoacetate hydrolase family protein [Paraburkholderia fungorum]RKF48328.1 5-carboxymethyl-2-hydroxymuconate isomerase [Paraburkholderia fungorum]
MKLSSVRIEGRLTWGIVRGNEFLDVGQVMIHQFADLKAAIAANLDGVAQVSAQAPSYALTSVEWLPVIPNPQKILCVGLNYEMHRKETGRSDVEHPTIFVRFASSQTAHLAPMIKPKVSAEFDYEGELALVIGKAGRYIERDEALAHVAGYACYNDGSVRDFQRHTHQYTPGKNFPGTGAFGPWMMTPDELGKLSKLTIETRLNGAVVQSACFDQMIFDIPRQIEYCSQFTCLEPGDVILTGTPGGIGARRNPPLWLHAGDVVEVEVERLGVLTNRIEEEA